jgi:hypothetical protein
MVCVEELFCVDKDVWKKARALWYGMFVEGWCLVLLEQEASSSYRKRGVWLFISDSGLDDDSSDGYVLYVLRGECVGFD